MRPSDFESSPGHPALPEGPLSCVEGELAEHADLRLTDLICETVFAAGLGETESTRVLHLLRVTYWLGFYDRSGMWYSTHERDQFDAAVMLLSCETGEALADDKLLYARLVGEADAADACAGARGAD